MEAVAHEAQEHNNELNAQNVALSAAKNQLDSEINLLRVRWNIYLSFSLYHCISVHLPFCLSFFVYVPTSCYNLFEFKHEAHSNRHVFQV